MTATTWRQMARALASRMVNHAYCADHPTSEAQPDCPYCEDRAVYRQFLAMKAREDAARARSAARSARTSEPPAR